MRQLARVFRAAPALRGALAALTLLATAYETDAAGTGRPDAVEPADEEYDSLDDDLLGSATTHAEFSQEVFERLRDEVVDVYTETSTDPPELKQQATEWLTLLSRADADLGGAPSWDELYTQGDALLDAGCQHPVVVSYAAHCDLLRGRLGRSRERHDLVAQPLLDGEYGAVSRFYEAFRLMRLEYLWGRSGGRYASEKKVAETWLDMAREETDPVRLRVVWRELLWYHGQAWDRDARKRLMDAAAVDEEIDPWLRAMIAGKVAYDLAWAARGGSYAGDVDERMWDEFHEQLENADTHFQLALDLQPDNPEAAAELIQVATGAREGGAEPARRWFDVARDAQYDYLPAYNNLLWAMRPRWYGSHNDMYALAQEWAAEERFETNAPYKAIRAIYDIGSEIGGREAALKPESPYRLVVSMLDAMADDPAHAPSSRRNYDRAYLLSHRLGAGMLSGRDDEARVALDTLVEEGLEVDEGVMRGYDLDPELQIPRLYARTGKAAKAVVKLAELTWEEKRGSRDARQRAVDAYADAKRATDDPRSDGYFDHWIHVYSMERDFLDGKWVEPRFDSKYLDWHLPVGGLWEIESPTSVVARQSDVTSVPRLWSPCYLADPYEVEVEITPLFETGDSAWTGLRAEGKGGVGRYGWINQTKSVVGISRKATCTKVRDVTPKDTHLLSMRVWPGYVELWIDGEMISSDENEEFQPSGYFALSAVRGTGHASECRYSNVRFRKLDPRPRPQAEDVAEETDESAAESDG